MKLNEISDNEGARKGRMRIGRGIGSGKGKQSGRGGKGQTARTGVRIKGFEGGQMPMHRRLPKRGFNNIFRVEYAEINLDRLQEAIDAKTLDAGSVINAEALVKAGRGDLIGGCDGLIPAQPPKGAIEKRRERANDHYHAVANPRPKIGRAHV